MTCCPFRSERCQQVGVFLAISVVFGINSIVLLAFLYAMNKRETAFMISLALMFFTWGGSYGFVSCNQQWPVLYGIFGERLRFLPDCQGCCGNFRWRAGSCGCNGSRLKYRFCDYTSFTSFIAFALATFVIPKMGCPVTGGGCCYPDRTISVQFPEV